IACPIPRVRGTDMRVRDPLPAPERASAASARGGVDRALRARPPMLAIDRVDQLIMERGRLITIEGIDGAGKTTLAAGLEAALKTSGVDVRLLREPGGVRVAERIREVVMDPELEVGARAEALLYAAARAQLVEQAVSPT